MCIRSYVPKIAKKIHVHVTFFLKIGRATCRVVIFICNPPQYALEVVHSSVRFRYKRPSKRVKNISPEITYRHLNYPHEPREPSEASGKQAVPLQECEKVVLLSVRLPNESLIKLVKQLSLLSH